MAAIPLRRDEIHYPESDGKPMGETGIHVEETIYLLEALKDRLRDVPDVYVGGDMFLYYVEGQPRYVVCPDVFVSFGVGSEQRRIYKLWEEGRPPALIVEVTSSETRNEDLNRKKDLYERLGVQEYLLYDPLGEYLKPPLRGFQRIAGRYEPLAPSSDGSIQSPLLGLTFQMEDSRIRLVDTATGEPILRNDEVRELARQTQTAEERAAAAEEEAARLRAELERLRRRG
ncbi:MAG TPA: Uma2 family endonuclease [Thermoanaerobaculia bacterium]